VIESRGKVVARWERAVGRFARAWDMTPQRRQSAGIAECVIGWPVTFRVETSGRGVPAATITCLGSGARLTATGRSQDSQALDYHNKTWIMIAFRA
jgi:hypothetical protein